MPETLAQLAASVRHLTATIPREPPPQKQKYGRGIRAMWRDPVKAAWLRKAISQGHHRRRLRLLWLKADVLGHQATLDQGLKAFCVGKPYSPQEVRGPHRHAPLVAQRWEFIRRVYRKGMDMRDIARFLWRDRTTVRNALAHMGELKTCQEQVATPQFGHVNGVQL